MAKKYTQPAPESKPIRGFGKIIKLLRTDWPEYVVEIIVIIFSITISFAFDEWKDQRQKKETEQTYLKGLYSDIQADMNQLQEIIAETQLVVQKARHLSELNTQPPSVTYSNFVEDVRFVFKRPRFISEDATFADLKSTGNMQVISDFSLKRSLFDYYRKYETIVQVETAELETTNTIVGPYILKRLPLAKPRNSVSRTEWLSIPNDIEFQNAMLVRHATREELLRDYQETIKLGRQILTSIKLQLN
ncbi:hypothetical protein [Spirosoma daeguense]